MKGPKEGRIIGFCLTSAGKGEEKGVGLAGGVCVFGIEWLRPKCFLSFQVACQFFG